MLKAVYFDRDGTLAHDDPAWIKLRDESLTEWSGKPFHYTDEMFGRLFVEVLDGGFPFAPYHNVEEEIQFFRQWYRFLFAELHITEHVEERLDLLTDRLWYWGKVCFPETLETLEYFCSRGWKMGVISDCPPSLEMTLKNCGIHSYFTSFTASSLAGEGKPSPVIFGAALRDQGVLAVEALYVDDTKIEADGAREQGFTSFWLDRSGRESGEWVIHSLLDLVEYARELEGEERQNG